ncbi:MAG: 16S rRNA (uracil(1498)-N(3))-methyltransferase [Thermodesulfobacteriota bacterium]
MKRFVVERIEPTAGRAVIRGSEARHIGKVLRMGPGDPLILMDRAGLRFLSRIESVGPGEVTVSLDKALPAPSLSPLRLVLAPALLRSGPMDFVIQKAAELGVNRIQPFSCERTVVRLSAEGTGNRLRHWKEIAVSATKQSDRERPPEISSPSPLRDLLTRWSPVEAPKILLWEGEETRDLKSLLRGQAVPREAIGVVGPEGGFSTKEVAAARNAGFTPVSLGHRILRAETAVVVLVAMLQYEWGDLSLGGSA